MKEEVMVQVTVFKVPFLWRNDKLHKIIVFEYANILVHLKGNITDKKLKFKALLWHAATKNIYFASLGQLLLKWL